MAVGTRPRGRPPATTREAVVAAAMHHFLHSRRIDVQALAAQTGVSRATIYRWFGSRDGLVGAAMVEAFVPVVAHARASTSRRGAAALADTFAAVADLLAVASGLRSFLESEREGALRLVTASDGPVQPHVVAMVRQIIETEVGAGYRPAVDIETLAYATVRLVEAFLYNDAVVGVNADVHRLRPVLEVIFAAPARQARSQN
jgi:AcrR family transcriptional regulator